MLASRTKSLLAASLACACAFAGVSSAEAASYRYADRLSGVNTKDVTASLAITQGTVVSYTATGWGSGTNNLRFRVQQSTGGSWVDLVDRSFSMSGSGASRSISGSFSVANYVASSTENIRFVFSRAALTSAIDWQLDISY